MSALEPVKSSQVSQVCLIRFEVVLRRTSLGRTKIYELISKGDFPEPLKVGAASLWRDDEISGWIDSLSSSRDPRGTEQDSKELGQGRRKDYGDLRSDRVLSRSLG